MVLFEPQKSNMPVSAWLFWPDAKGSYVCGTSRREKLEHNFSHVCAKIKKDGIDAQTEEKSLLSKEEVDVLSKNILEHIQDLYNLKGRSGGDLWCWPLASLTGVDETYVRLRIGAHLPRKGQSRFVRLALAKSTHATFDALEAVRIVAHESGRTDIVHDITSSFSSLHFQRAGV